MPTTAVAAPAHIPERSLTTERKKTHRIDSIDLLRGLVMIIMALDHSRDFFHSQAFTDDPLNFATTTSFLFFTRWITHYCAPVFVFLAGTSAWFQSQRKSKKELSGFLVKRGIWLIVMEVVLVNLAFTFDIHYGLVALQTIWSIGISMVILGLMIWLPFQAIGLVGLFLVLGHNSLDFYERGHSGFGFWYSLLHHQGIFHLWGSHYILVLYPFLSWAGLMMMGYCFGKFFGEAEGARRKRVAVAMGAGIVLFFVALRSTNLYGDPDPWSSQKNLLFSLLSFVNTHKYPPSLLYMCMTIGPALLFLGWAGKTKSRLGKIITVYGRVPFFYYVLHFFVLHLLATLFFVSRGHSLTEGTNTTLDIAPKFVVPGEGYSLWVVYAVWISVVALLYPLCKWFSDYKIKHRNWWLSYL